MATSRYLKWPAAALVLLVVLVGGAALMTEVGHLFGIPTTNHAAYNMLGVPAGVAAMVAAFTVWSWFDDRS